MQQGFLRTVVFRDEVEPDWDNYPFSIPAVRQLGGLAFDPKVTFFVGENGSGKSTIIEALAAVLGMNPEGGSKNLRFATRSSESNLHEVLRTVRNARREQTEFFLRAESYYNVATALEEHNSTGFYGGSPHEQSHGESFLNLVLHRFGPQGLYLLDEPEAALSPQRQLSFLARMHELVEQDSQFIIATHSPILMAFPQATIFLFSEDGIEEVEYEETDHYQLTRDFLNHRERYFQHLFE
ncbi:ATP-binding cassette domain-containing protein [Persicimonas caeni]|uniref:ATP-binding cassette domain-containing protein n=1 Tax=Persicimonas caeni TaxID=2292766 RepID=A0A4Y6PZB8_PERCE|nr:AAA family ATPase [Persicimonas caeni]QDG53095.1 ATP-binding cassette domain-containing protein [Persicimonas caeni]QED34317.1 AAA family ATPase [Persicimonas caeni]